MPTLKPISILLAGTALMMVSCTPPKATVVEQAPATKKNEQAKVPEPVPQEQVPLPPEDDGIRMGNILEMPKDGDFRATNPSRPAMDGQPGTVVSRPPTEPPSRVKPKESGDKKEAGTE